MSRTIKANPNFSDMSLILHNATLMGQHKNKKFLSKLIDDKHLSFEGVSNSSDFSKIKSDFFAILDLFEAKYKDQGDLDFYFDGAREQFTPYFKVLYPKFTITNSQGKTHEIRDLFVFHNFKWSNNAIHPYKLEGGRFSKTKLEVLSGYQQSHLGSHGSWLNTPFYCSYFCVGGDTDVSRMLAEFSVEMDIDRYELFLFCVDSMITWESLEGVPFIRMENIKNADSYRVTSISSRMVERVVNTILSDKITLDVDFYISGGMYRIHPNTRASNFIKDVILRYFSFSDYKTLLVSKVPNTYNHYLAMKAENAATSNTIEIVAKEEYTIFRGKKIYPKIIKEDARLLKPVSIEDHIVYPNFLENVIRKLESRIYEKAVVKSATKLYHTSNNAQRSVVSDTVSL
jgi:hypothetical protein